MTWWIQENDLSGRVLSLWRHPLLLREFQEGAHGAAGSGDPEWGTVLAQLDHRGPLASTLLRSLQCGPLSSVAV